MNRLLVALGSVLLTVGTALAHSGHDGHAAGGGGPNVAVPISLLVGGVLVLGTSVYLEHAGALEGKYARAGVLLGVVGLLAGVGLGLQAGF